MTEMTKLTDDLRAEMTKKDNAVKNTLKDLIQQELEESVKKVVGDHTTIK